MAMLDYGAVVKKNGKIISDTKGGLFQNFSTLKYEVEEKEPFRTIVDETIVGGFDWNNKPVKYSMAGNFFAIIGDEHFLIGFYKDAMRIALNMKNYNGIPCLWMWFDNHVKPITFDVKDNDKLITTITVSKAQKDNDSWFGSMSVYIAKFSYNGDDYEVLYGYGIDPNINFTFSEYNYYQHKRKKWRKIGNRHLIEGHYFFRKGLKFIRKWTWDGLTEEQRLTIPKKYRLK